MIISLLPGGPHGGGEGGGGPEGLHRSCAGVHHHSGLYHWLWYLHSTWWSTQADRECEHVPHDLDSIRALLHGGGLLLCRAGAADQEGEGCVIIPDISIIFGLLQPGGDYTYILDSLGPFIGFIRLWAECLIVRPCTITIVALTFAKYSVKLIFPECEPPDESVRILAAVCICEYLSL